MGIYLKVLICGYKTILGEIKIKKDYYYSDELKNGFYPLEEEYPFLKDYCLPDLKELICYTSALNPYDLTQEILEKLSNIKISTAHIQKVTNSTGKSLIEKEEYLINNPAEYSENKRNIDKIVISMDGAMINTYDDWKEVKTGVIYELQNSKNGIESINKSYVSKIEDHISFRKRLKNEARRRQYLDAKELIVIGDGARWIWDLAENEFPSSIKILDWYHAKEHLHKIVDLLYHNNIKKIKEIDEILSELLYNGDINCLIKIVNDNKIESNIIDRLDDLVSLQTEIEYFSKNRDKMQYKYFEEKGYPIGSGIIEAACKQVVQLRLKRNGMRWKKDNAHNVLKIRTMYLSSRWNEVVSVIRKVA
ncbi:MAG TPA: ISKra4 family transposase [Spirochaetota bacterium]|nr:ISKra4 family transposase [Spirochaetota bacterium]